MKIGNFHNVFTKTFKILLVCIIAAFVSFGCGGSGGGDRDPDSGGVKGTGVFIDAAVMGLKYISGSDEGYTGSTGTFEYDASKKIKFYIGDIELGIAVTGKNMISPIDLVEGGTIDNEEVINIARFLQSLDEDTTDEIITIPLSVHIAAKDMTLIFSSSFFDDEAEDILARLTESNDSYDSVPELVSKETAKKHLSFSIVSFEGGEVPGGTDTDTDTSTGTDTDINYGVDDDTGYDTIQPFSTSEVKGEYIATITNLSSKTLSLTYTFGDDGSGTITYPESYPGPCSKPEIEWEITTDGRIKYTEFCGGFESVTKITRYKNGDVLWTSMGGVIGFKAEFEKVGSTDTNPLLGDWTATDNNLDADQTSKGTFTIEEKSGEVFASGAWVATVKLYGIVATTRFPFTNVPVTITDGMLSFTAEGTATESTSLLGSSGYTLEVLNGTTTSCTYRVNVDSKKWKDLWKDIMGEISGDYIYSGDADVTIK